MSQQKGTKVLKYTYCKSEISDRHGLRHHPGEKVVRRPGSSHEFLPSCMQCLPLTQFIPQIDFFLNFAFATNSLSLPQPLKNSLSQEITDWFIPYYSIWRMLLNLYTVIFHHNYKKERKLADTASQVQGFPNQPASFPIKLFRSKASQQTAR